MLCVSASLPRPLHIPRWRCTHWPESEGELWAQFHHNYELHLSFIPAKSMHPYSEALLLQFQRIANLYFLVVAVCLSIPEISPISPVTAWAPLIIVITISMAREGKTHFMQATRTISATSPTGNSISRPRPISSALANSKKCNGAALWLETFARSGEMRPFLLIWFSCPAPLKVASPTLKLLRLMERMIWSREQLILRQSLTVISRSYRGWKGFFTQQLQTKIYAHSMVVLRSRTRQLSVTRETNSCCTEALV